MKSNTSSCLAQVKEVEREYLLQHVVQQIVVTAVIKSRFDFDLKVAHTDEAHHVFRLDTDSIRIGGVDDAHDRRVPYPIVRRLDAEWEYEQVLIFPAQVSNRLVGDWEQSGDILSLECLLFAIVCQVNSHLLTTGCRLQIRSSRQNRPC